MFPFKTLEEKYRSIPDDIREAISSSEVNQKLRNLTEKYKLQFDEAEELTKEIGFVMLGLKSSSNFIKNIQTATELDYQTAKKIAEDVNNIIFKDIRKSLKQIHSKSAETTDNPNEKIEKDEELEELGEKQVRAELVKEIEKPTEKITDLIKINQDKKESPAREVKQAEQKQPEKVIMDPYREPIE